MLWLRTVPQNSVVLKLDRHDPYFPDLGERAVSPSPPASPKISNSAEDILLDDFSAAASGDVVMDNACILRWLEAPCPQQVAVRSIIPPCKSQKLGFLHIYHILRFLKLRLLIVTLPLMRSVSIALDVGCGVRVTDSRIHLFTCRGGG